MAPQPSVSLSELEFDALSELVNLGVGNAATGLREMVREEVLLSVPKVSIVPREQAIADLGPHGVNRLVAVHQHFEGDIRGRALLIFPEAQSMELVRAVVGDELSLEDIMELEQEAMAETGNVLLNTCLGTIANNLRRSLRISLPEVIQGNGSQLLSLSPEPCADDIVLFIYIDFSVRNRNIQGYLAMLLDLPSLVALKSLLAEYIARVENDAPPSGVHA